MFYSQPFSPQTLPQPQQQPPQMQQPLHPQHSSSPFSSPVLSASASPYITAKAPTLSPASALPTEVGLGGGALTLGSQIRVRATEGLHPKLAPYAGQIAEIIELPSHPNTWFGVRLGDGRQVKLRKTAFDVESTAPHQHHQQQQASQQHQMHLAQQQQQQAQTQQQHHYSLNAYPQNPFSHYHQLPPQQQQYAQGLTHHLQPPTQQYAYSSPSPIASPTLSPALSAITAPTQASSSSYTLPMSQLRLDPDSGSFDQPASAVKRVTASATPVLSQTNSPVLAGQRTPKQQHTPRQHHREDAEGEAMSGTESAGSGTDDDALRRSRGASLTDDPEPSMIFASASTRKPIPQGQAAAAEDDEDSEASADDAADDSDDDDEDGAGGATHSHKPVSSLTKASKSAASKQSRSRRGRGRALLGLNVVVINGRYKGESGFVTKGANGYYSVQFHRAMPELRNLDNTAMKRSSELAPITAQGKRLMLPLAPAQRKVMKAEAAAATTGGSVGAGTTKLVKSDSAPASASASQSVSPTTSHKRKATFAVPSRKTAVYRRADAKRSQQQQRGSGNQSDSHSDCSSCRSDSGSLDDESDGQDAADAPRSRGRPRTQAHNWHSHRRSHSNSSVSSSSSSSNALQGSPHTELLSPRSFPPSPAVTLTSSPSRAFALQMQLPSMSLGPTHFEQKARVAPGSGSKSASMRSQSPGIKKAASILVALSHQAEVTESSPPPLHPVAQQQLHAQQLQLQAQHQQQHYSHPHPHPQPHPMQHNPFAVPVAPSQLTYQLSHMPSSPHAHMMYAVSPQHPHQQQVQMQQQQRMEGTVWRPA